MVFPVFHGGKPLQAAAAKVKADAAIAMVKDGASVASAAKAMRVSKIRFFQMLIATQEEGRMSRILPTIPAAPLGTPTAASSGADPAEAQEIPTCGPRR